MKKLLLVAGGIYFCQAVLVAPVMATNVLSNAGFEYEAPQMSQSIAGWTCYGQLLPNMFNQSGSDARNGCNFFKVFQGYTGSINYSGIYQDSSCGPGATYTADGWVKLVSTNVLSGQNMVWIQVTFHDISNNVLALYKSSVITTNAILRGTVPKDTWFNLSITNQYDPRT